MSTSSRLFVALAVASALSVSANMGFAKDIAFVVDDPKGRDVVSFNSDAPLELIVGTTHKIKGRIVMDDSLDFSKKPFTATFDVDLSSIDTGIPLRNEHMRDNFLETAKYPKAVFSVVSVAGKPTVLKDGETVKVDAVGEFKLHGKSVSKKIPVEVTLRNNCKTTQEKYANCDLIQIKSKFPVAFKDHDIKRPEIVFQKLSDTVIVSVSATARYDLPQKASTK